MMKNKIIILLFFVLPVFTFGQEVITGLYTNPQIKANMYQATAKTAKGPVVTLPFIDDFSNHGIFPVDSLWADKYVFINSSYPSHSVSIGVATFDALNDTGALYTEASAYGFLADSLTSLPIRLDSVFGIDTTALKIGDSLYFSFYYQPQGIGNAPETDDSLVLEFYSPKDSIWRHVWASPGMTLAQFHGKYNVFFKQTMIPITDSLLYFKNGFRFRFYNYASLANNSLPSWAGNVDQWNLDYVYLNKGRNMADSVYKDITFTEPATSVLKNYTSMPWSQFNVSPSTEIKDTLYNSIFNLDTVTYNTSYKYEVADVNGPWTFLHPGGSTNLDPLSYQTYTAHATPAVDFSFPSLSTDSAEFTVAHVIKEGLLGDSRRSNDTTIFNQKFFNYYAYDDGVPEGGYGLTPENSMLAYKFTLNHPDTLRAVRMFFNRTLDNASQQYFNLTVWNDASGYPGDTLYTMKHIKPQYGDSLNVYYNYRIENRKVPVSGTFYVGWKQMTADNLNLGFDINNDEQNKIFYNTGSGWMSSNFHGALMIRPVVGEYLPPVAGINEFNVSNGEMKVYPNPSNGQLINIHLTDISNTDLTQFTIRVFDLMGNEVYNTPFINTLDCSGLSNGIYMISVTSGDSSRRYFSRLAIVK
jgi:hypothetical protein